MNDRYRNGISRVVFLTVLAALSACGGGGGSSNGPNDSTDAAPAANAAPIANAGADRRVILGTARVTLDGSGSSDPDGTDLQFSWTFVQRPAGSNAPLSGANTAAPSFTPDLVGMYRVELAVSDGQHRAVDLIDIDVAVNTNPTGNAGADQQINRGETVALDASASSDPDEQPLTYTWTQVVNGCPDVTGGSGILTGVRPNFVAPNEICTVAFDLRVNDGLGDSFADRVLVLVLEDKTNALFVNGASGNDADAGTRAAPKRTIQAAIDAAASTGADVYISAGTYEAGAFNLASGVSLYGGYDLDWQRYATGYRPLLRGGTRAVSGTDVSNLTLDGLAIESADAFLAGESSYGLVLANASRIALSRNVINAGRGASGVNGIRGTDGSAGGHGGSGGNGSCDAGRGGYGGGPGPGAVGTYAGGAGGFGGDPGANNGGAGRAGQAPSGGSTLGGPGGVSGDPGGPGMKGRDGANGAAGSNGTSSAGVGTFADAGYVATNAGGAGAAGLPGAGGGGGGGGGGQEHNAFGVGGGAGNGGGGGGSGGVAGGGGAGGGGGGGSFGIYLVNATAISMQSNQVTTAGAGAGGNGGASGRGAPGGRGGAGGIRCTEEVGAGGNGGNGGRGGDGGQGGGGGGGPSVGIAADSRSQYTATSNVYTLGAGGVGGAPNGAAGLQAETHGF